MQGVCSHICRAFSSLQLQPIMDTYTSYLKHAPLKYSKYKGCCDSEDRVQLGGNFCSESMSLGTADDALCLTRLQYIRDGARDSRNRAALNAPQHECLHTSSQSKLFPIPCFSGRRKHQCAVTLHQDSNSWCKQDQPRMRPDADGFPSIYCLTPQQKDNNSQGKWMIRE